MTSERAPGSALRWSGVLLVGLACGAVALVAAGALNGVAVAELMARAGAQPLATAVLVAVPIVAAIVAALLMPTPASGGSAIDRRAATAERGAAARAGTRSAKGDGKGSGRDARAQAVSADSSAAGRPEDAALQLLGLLQQEGRFVDFVEEDLGDYSDEQVGSAVRAIHDGCRTALRERLALAPILPGAEGGSVTVERGFDPAAVRVTGNVRGEPPYHGVIRHPGWRSTSFSLPAPVADHDASILAPAEVEVL
jgi:hypothetical protein